MASYQTLDQFDFPTAFLVSDAEHILSTDGQADEVHDWRSVTKLPVAWAVLVAVEQGHLDLDQAAGPEGSTVRHLIAHASGLPFDKGGRTSKPGQRRVYSNVGFEKLGEVVAEATGGDIHTWVREQVLEPLDLSSVVFDGSPAFGMSGNATDLVTFGHEMLHPTLISEHLATEARTVQFPGLDGVLPGYGRQSGNDWGLGLEIRGKKSPHWTATVAPESTFGHFGQSGSFLWVDPEAELIGAFLGERDFDTEVHGKLWAQLNDEVYQAHVNN